MSEPAFQPSMDIAQSLAGMLSAIPPFLDEHDMTEEDVGIVAARYAAEDRVADFAGHNAAQPFYPASVVKLGWGLVAYEALEAGTLEAHHDLSRALVDMLSISSNAATNYVVDHLSDHTGDTPLGGADFANALEQRQHTTRRLEAFKWPEWQHCQIVQKASDEDRYGRERQFRDALGHNVLTPVGAARLLHESVRGTSFPPGAVTAMRAALARPVARDAIDAEPISQVRGFLGEALIPLMPKGARVFSKAGWSMFTGDAQSAWHRHDAICCELPDGTAHLFVVLTQGRTAAESTTLLPAIGKQLAEFFLPERAERP